MAITNLLVGYDGLPVSEAALARALLMRDYFDAHLTVPGLHEMAEGFDRTHPEIRPDRVAFDHGRPVIVFTEGITGAVIGSKAVLAWDGGRGAWQ